MNWYPALYVLDQPDPFGFPAAFQFASPIAALALRLGAWLVWRTGVRHYRRRGAEGTRWP